MWFPAGDDGAAALQVYTCVHTFFEDKPSPLLVVLLVVLCCGVMLLIAAALAEAL